MAANDTIDYEAALKALRGDPLTRIAAALERIAAALEREAPSQVVVEKSEPPQKRDYIGMPG